LQSSVELELFINRAEGYELLLPAIWAPTEVERGDSQTATAFGSGAGFGTRSAPALTIIVGETDGSITPCTCPRTKVSSLDDLEELVVSTPSFFHTGPPEQHSELTLDGEQARSESAGIGNNCLGCPDAFFHVYAIHDGRPFVLAFDYWTVRFRTISTPEIDLNFSPQTLDTILNSFRFLEPAAVEQPDVVDGVRTFVSSDGSFQLELPQDWRLDRGTDWTALYLNRGVTQLSVRAGDDRGSILTNLRARGRNA
jgi:hypothetical protein